MEFDMYIKYRYWTTKFVPKDGSVLMDADEKKNFKLSTKLKILPSILKKKFYGGRWTLDTQIRGCTLQGLCVCYVMYGFVLLG